MNDDDRAAILDLFRRLREVEGRSGPRDPEAEALIRSAIASQPGAPYYMAQTIIVQNAALREAERRIAELESRGEERGGLFGGLFGSGGGRSSVPPAGRRREEPAFAGRGESGGFLAGAAQTALGVAGGVLIGNMIAGAMFGGDASAEEAPPEQETPEEEMDADSDFGGDLGGDFGGDF
ncbi:MAG TPA: DUF2076 domain-containing protein [Bauldia sp.]|nr:DUF2076 domain-containing protein [Bauldia sp.]